MTQITAYLAGAGAFFVALFLCSGFFGPMFGLLGAGAAGYYAWKHFNDKHTAELAALLNPPDEVWPLRIEEAWLCLEDVLATFHMESGVSGVSRWHTLSKDNNRGILQAQIDFKQALGTPTSPTIFSRTVILDAELSPEEESTKVQIKYHIHSPSGTAMVQECIKTTQASMKNRIAIEKGA
jgi:hypothetical protein